MENYSFLTSIYKNSKIDEMQVCVESMVNQTLPPEQIVVVIDGPVPDDLFNYINSLKGQNEKLFTVVSLKENVGLGRALNEGMQVCRNELVARMDTDDICVLDRMEKEINYLQRTNADIVGSNIAEFIGNKDTVVSYRNVPTRHEDICKYLKKRCPFNHMTVLFKKSKVEEAGGYKHWFYDEDSYLWARMYLVNTKFANIDEVLVYTRIKEETFQRRGGYKYYKSERDLFKFMYKNKIINWYEYQESKFIRFVVQVLMPNSVRQWFFKKFARN